jgi:hypothetical protein
MRQASAGIAECTTLSIEVGDSNELFDRMVVQACVFVGGYLRGYIRYMCLQGHCMSGAKASDNAD